MNSEISYNKTYYENNKDRIKEMMTKKIECEVCKKMVSKCNLPKHQRTEKCQKVNKNKQESKYSDKIENLMEMVQQLLQKQNKEESNE